MSEALPDLPETYIRAYLLAQLCPWCQTGPWRVVAQHVRIVHGVTSRQLCDLAGFSRRDSITAVEVTERLRDLSRAHQNLTRNPPQHPRRVSVAE